MKTRKSEAARQAWLARIQEFDDPQLGQRVIDAVDQAIRHAEPGQAHTDIINGTEHTSVWWTWKQDGDTSAQKGPHPDGSTTYEIAVDGGDPDDGPWVLVTSDHGHGPAVRWMPGQGFDNPGAFLDWFEDPS
jgi:hypothetical protein